jgi:acetoin utilization deacetylase AcuC-like enzyme
VAGALALRGQEVMVREQHDITGSEISSRNSEVTHAGIYYPPGSLRARLCVEDKAMLCRLCAENGVPHRALTKLLWGRATAVAAPLWPSTDIIDSHGLMLALEGHIEAHGGQLMLNSPVARRGRTASGLLEVMTGGVSATRFTARRCAGVRGRRLRYAGARDDGAGDMPMTTLLITHPSFLLHDTGPGHPERPDRMRILERTFAAPEFASLERREAPLRDDVEQWIALAHPQRYIDAIKAARPVPGEEPVRLDPDTVLSSASWGAALRAVGSGLLAVDEVVGGRADNAFAQVRPCGHHAETARAMGFCIFNNIAIAGMYARKRHGLERIAVVDFDVHHGNGTQDIFWRDKDLFFASTHQMPLYPGTGALGETGVGNICNAPLRPGDGGTPFREAFESRILPALRNFGPDIVLVSAGFDAHRDDPLANLTLVEEDFAWATEKLAEAARRQAGGRLVSMLEGGYNLAALGRSAAAHVKGLMAAGG